MVKSEAMSAAVNPLRVLYSKPGCQYPLHNGQQNKHSAYFCKILIVLA